MNKEKEIRKLLGNRYHLTISYDKNLELERWILFRKYYDSKIYFSEDNEAIMSSDKNTWEELYEFAKKHHKVDDNMKTRRIIMIMAWINCFLSIANIFWGNKTIRTIVLVNDFDLLFIYITLTYFWNKNLKVDMLELRENFEKCMKSIQTQNENDKKRKNKKNE